MEIAYKNDRCQGLQIIYLDILIIQKPLGANIKLLSHKTLVRSVMIHACPVWEFLKLQRL
jgi:hypothetical protein